MLKVLQKAWERYFKSCLANIQKILHYVLHQSPCQAANGFGFTDLILNHNGSEKKWMEGFKTTIVVDVCKWLEPIGHNTFQVISTAIWSFFLQVFPLRPRSSWKDIRFCNKLPILVHRGHGKPGNQRLRKHGGSAFLEGLYTICDIRAFLQEAHVITCFSTGSPCYNKHKKFMHKK